MFKSVLYALHLQSVGLSGLAVRCCCLQIYIVSQMKATDEPITNWNGNVLFVEGIMCVSLGLNIEQNKGE